MISKATVAKVLAGTTLIGGVAFGTLKFTGQADLDAIKAAYNRAVDNISILQSNETKLKNAITEKLALITGYKSKAESLQTRVNELTQQLEEAKNNKTEDTSKIKELEVQIKQLQSQINDGITDDQYNSLLGEIERLQGELTKANTQIASLKNEVLAKDAQIKDAKAVTDEELNGNIDTSDLYFSWEGGPEELNNYLNNQQIRDDRNESPVTISSEYNNWAIGNVRAYKKLYDSINGDGAFLAKYNEALATYKQGHPKETDQNNIFYAALSNTGSLQITVGKTVYNISCNPDKPLSTDTTIARSQWDGYWFNKNAENPLF